jgi:hypothetical protein
MSKGLDTAIGISYFISNLLYLVLLLLACYFLCSNTVLLLLVCHSFFISLVHTFFVEGMFFSPFVIF